MGDIFNVAGCSDAVDFLSLNPDTAITEVQCTQIVDSANAVCTNADGAIKDKCDKPYKKILATPDFVDSLHGTINTTVFKTGLLSTDVD